MPSFVLRVVAGAVLAIASGCAGTRIPEFDPTGEHIFTPGNATTTIDLPVIGDMNWPKPAFSAPPAEPRAADPFLASGATQQPLVGAGIVSPATSSPAWIGLPATVSLSPSQTVAPVGSEVVLLAGLCANDGYYVCNQPVQWTLSQESVGAMVAISTDGGPFWRQWMGTNSQQLGSNFCRTTTSGRERRLDRGTPDPCDDIQVLSGQTWVSLSSASEGVSYVTASSEAVADWRKRQQTAVIHWIDAQWTFPAPALARAGQSQSLTTTVHRQTSGEPVVGWIVRYEITGGSAAQLIGPDGSSGHGIDVMTNEQGQAVVSMASVGDEPGSTSVGVTIIRPEVSGVGVNRLRVGTGNTSVTWSAPGLAVHLTGPATTGLDETIRLNATVSNPGDLTATDVTLNLERTPHLELQSSTPAGQVFGERLEWRLGDLAPHSSQTVELTMKATRGGIAQPCVSATSSEGLTAEACHDLSIVRPTFDLRVAGPETVVVGEQVRYQIAITNISDTLISNVTLMDSLGSGLRFSGDAHVLRRSVDDIAPGETKQIVFVLTAAAAGRLCHTVEVSAPGAISVSRQACVEASQPIQGNLSVRITGPTETEVGNVARYNIVVTNTGQTTLTNIHIVDQYDDLLLPEEASENHISTQGQLEWVLESLGPGEHEDFKVHYRCNRATDRACHKVIVASDQSVAVTEEACLSIVPREEETGRLEVEIADTSDPIRVGDTTTYIVTLINNLETSDHTVSVTFHVPEGMAIHEVTDPPVSIRSSTRDGRTFEMTPVAEIRAGETLSFRVVVRAIRPGRFTFETSVASRRLDDPLVITENTSVNLE